MKNFTFRLPVIVGILLSIVLSWLFPASALFRAREAGFDLPSFLGMPVGDALTWLVSAAVLGSLVALVLGYLKIDAAHVQLVTNIVVAVVGAALTAGLKFVPPDVLNMTVWQALLAIFALLSGLAGARVSGLWQANALTRGAFDPGDSVPAALRIAGEKQ